MDLNIYTFYCRKFKISMVKSYGVEISLVNKIVLLKLWDMYGKARWLNALFRHKK